MSDTIRKQIRAQALAALNDVGKPVGVPAAMMGGTSDPPIPSIRVFQVQDTSQVMGGARGPIVRRELSLAIEARAEVAAGGDPYSAVEPMESWINAALGGIHAPGVSHEFTEDSTTYHVAGEAMDAIVATVIYKISYQTRVNDATAWA